MSGFLESLRQFIHFSHDDQKSGHGTDAVPAAAAVLLLELAMVDDQASDAEHDVIESAIRQTFSLDPDQFNALIKEADKIQRQTTSLHEYTHKIRTHLNASQRGQLTEWLWRVAYADGRLDPYEEQLIRRLADLIGVPHLEMMRRKHRAASQTDSHP